MWKDLGTWNTLTEAMEENVIGKGELNDKCSGVHIINEMDVPVLAMGLHDVVISASPEGILVSDKEQIPTLSPSWTNSSSRLCLQKSLGAALRLWTWKLHL